MSKPIGSQLPVRAFPEAGKLAAAVLSLTFASIAYSAGPEQTNSLEACRVESQALREEVARLKAEAERLNVAILVLSKQLGGSPAAAPQAEVTPAPSGPARLLVKLTTKYNTGQSCPISVDGKEAGRIEYPSLDGYGRVMEYSSGFIEIAPGDHRIGIACTEKDGTKATSIYTDGAFRPGEEYLFHTKINIWSKALQSVSFGRAEVGGKQ